MHRAPVLIAGIVLSATLLPAQGEELGKWISLFDGKSTAGWRHARDPGKESVWKVEDGALTNGKDGVNDACTTAEFDDYELELEYRVPKGGNSGVYLRGVIEVQIADSHGKARAGMGDAGAIYSVSEPLENPSKPAGEWNRFRILHIGKRVSVWHNDVYVQDNRVVEKKTGGAMDGDGKRGPIMLQGDHSRVSYRNIRIRPLFQASEGWKPLWNGKDLSELNARGDARAKDGLRWKVEDHSLTNARSGGEGHDIWTNESFGNFLVHYEYRSDPAIEGGNSGFYLRDQWEIQIFAKTTKDPHSDGSLYSYRAPAVNARNGEKQWNFMDVKMQGMKITVWQNGKLIHDGAVLETRTDDHGRKTPAFTKAPFKLQGDHGKVWFTNLFIRPLPDDVAQK